MLVSGCTCSGDLLAAGILILLTLQCAQLAGETVAHLGSRVIIIV